MIYEWIFTTLDCYVEAEGQANVVYRVRFTLRGDDGSHTGQVGGTVACTYTAGDPFVEFDDLQHSLPVVGPPIETHEDTHQCTDKVVCRDDLPCLWRRAAAGDLRPRRAAQSAATAPAHSSRSGVDDAERRIDLLLHVDLNVGLGAGFDVRIIFGEVHSAEIERLELFGGKAAAIGMFGRTPAKAVEGRQLGAALLLDDAAEPGVEAAVTARKNSKCTSQFRCFRQRPHVLDVARLH